MEREVTLSFQCLPHQKHGVDTDQKCAKQGDACSGVKSMPVHLEWVEDR